MPSLRDRRFARSRPRPSARSTPTSVAAAPTRRGGRLAAATRRVAVPRRGRRRLGARRAAALGAVELERDWRHVALGLPDRYRAEPDFPDFGVVPSLWMGETGILLVAHTLAPAAWQEEQLLAAIETNAGNPTRELMWGSPGTMLAAQVLHDAHRRGHRRIAWEGSADRLWDAWRGRPVGAGPLRTSTAHLRPGARLRGQRLHPGPRRPARRGAARGARAACGCDARRARAACGRARPVAARRRAEQGAAPHPVVPRRARHRRVARVPGARRRRAHRAPGRGRRADLARRPARGRARTSVTALRATGTRSSSSSSEPGTSSGSAAPARSRCTRSSRSSRLAPGTAAGATRSGRATRERRSTSRAASTRLRRSRRSTCSKPGLASTRWSRRPTGADGHGTRRPG